MAKLPEYVTRAIQSGPVPKIRPIASIVKNPKTRGERVVAFAHRHLIVPEGMKQGQPLRLDTFQIAFILAVFDNPAGTTEAYASIARRNGKSFLVAVIMLAYLIGPEARENTHLASAAQSRDQAAIIFRLLVRMCEASPDLAGRYKFTPSSKTITGLAKNVVYTALSSDAKTNLGASLYCLCLDEAGQISEPSNHFVEMLESSQASHEDPIRFIISTQAPASSSYFSLQLDHAALGTDKTIVSHVYTANPDADFLNDPKEWKAANPGLGKFRSTKEMRKRMSDAQQLPSKANGIMNLNLNMRVSAESLLLSPLSWRKNLRPPNMISRYSKPIDIALDLSMRTDLTGCCAAWRDDDGDINVESYAFAPLEGVEARELRDKIPYQQLAREDKLQLTPGPIVDYEWVSNFIAERFEGCQIRSLAQDRYRMDLFIEACKRTPLYAMVGEFVPTGMGYITQGIQIDAFEQEVVRGKLRTGNHPLLNVGASQAIAVMDPAGNRKIAKLKSGTSRIDVLQACIMAVFPNSDGQVEEVEFDINALIV